MPVVTVAAPPHPAYRALLCGVADAIADALGLEPGGVIALGTPVTDTVANHPRSDAPEPHWILISIHGSDRGIDLTGDAREFAKRAAADWARTHGSVEGEVWCEWVLPQHR